mgnify:CR=1 FL=1
MWYLLNDVRVFLEPLAALVVAELLVHRARGGSAPVFFSTPNTVFGRMGEGMDAYSDGIEITGELCNQVGGVKKYINSVCFTLMLFIGEIEI